MADDENLSPSAAEEIAYWREELTLAGKHPDVVRRRLDPEARAAEFPPLLTHAVPIVRAQLGIDGPLKCLELGPGPLSTLAWGAQQGWLEVTAVDVLAREYVELLARHGVTDYPVVPIAGRGEELDSLLPEASFDLAYVSNALDHTDDARSVFRNLVRLTRPGGFLVLQHHLDEGTHREWSPSHKWNLSFAGGSLVATDRNGSSFDLVRDQELELVYLHYRSYLLDGCVDTIYRLPAEGGAD